MKNMREPIGVFDSGVGGISVLKELVKELPQEDFYYFGDSANAPYGTKTAEEVLHLSEQVVESLLNQGAKAIVIACNTATSAAAQTLRNKYKELPIIGIEPALKPAVLAKKDAHVLVMATPVTLRLEKFHRLLEQFGHEGQVSLLPCPGLMELVEEGNLEGLETEQFLRKLLTPYIGHIDSVVLGCTHYPFVKALIQKILGDDVLIYDGAAGTARELRRRLEKEGLLNPASHKGEVTFYNSKNTEEEIELSKYLFNR